MKAANILFTAAIAATLGGCGAVNYARNAVSPQAGHSVMFVSGNSSSVLIDFDASRAGELQYADAMAKTKCAIFGKSSATLESLNPRAGDDMRATYLCK